MWQIFFDLADASEDEINRRLPESCKGDLELQAEVRKLLSANRIRSPLDRPPFEMVSLPEEETDVVAELVRWNVHSKEGDIILHDHGAAGCTYRGGEPSRIRGGDAVVDPDDLDALIAAREDLGVAAVVRAVHGSADADWDAKALRSRCALAAWRFALGDESVPTCLPRSVDARPEWRGSA